jgi:hypothetical protein
LYLKNSNISGFADAALNYGLPGDYPVVGDWDGDGDVTIGIYRNGTFYLKNSNEIGFADNVFPFGQPGDQPIAGDWDGDGDDTIGIFRPSNAQFFLRNTNSQGTPDVSFFPRESWRCGDRWRLEREWHRYHRCLPSEQRRDLLEKHQRHGHC